MQNATTRSGAQDVDFRASGQYTTSAQRGNALGMNLLGVSLSAQGLPRN